MQINEFINLNIAQIAPDFSGFLQSIQTIDNENVTISIGAALPNGYALSAATPIAITPDSWHEPVSGPSETRDDEGGGYEANSEIDTPNSILEGLRVSEAGVLPSDIAARTVGTITPTTPAVASTNAVTQIAPSSFGGANARPGQATRPGRAGNIDQQQNAKVFDQLTNSLVISSVAIAPAIALPSFAAAENVSPELTSGAITAQESSDTDAARAIRAQTDVSVLRSENGPTTQNEAQDTPPPQTAEPAPVSNAAAAVPVEEDVAENLPTEAIGAQPEDVQPANRPPTIAPLNDAKSEEDAAYQIHLLTGGSDAEGDVFYIANAVISATDQAGAPVTLPEGAATITGNVLNLDPMAFDALNSNQSVTLRVAYDVTDGIGATPTTAAITISGFTDPYLTITPLDNVSLTENQAGDVTAIALGQIQADGYETPTYRFTNGSLAQGDFRIDPDSGAISYVGSGFDRETPQNTANIAPIAALSTDVPEWHIGDAEDNLAAMVDGNISSAGTDNYAVHPRYAHGHHITFDFDDKYTDPTFVFYNRVGLGEDRINGSTVSYRLNGTEVHSETLHEDLAVNDVISVVSSADFAFNQVVLTFVEPFQNFREN